MSSAFFFFKFCLSNRNLHKYILFCFRDITFFFGFLLSPTFVLCRGKSNNCIDPVAAIVLIHKMVILCLSITLCACVRVFDCFCFGIHLVMFLTNAIRGCDTTTIFESRRATPAVPRWLSSVGTHRRTRGRDPIPSAAARRPPGPHRSFRPGTRPDSPGYRTPP